jgi:hypothetical protein
MTSFRIPLVALAQTLTVSLSGVSYQLKVYWCDPLGAWVMDIADSQGNPMAGGLPLITGNDLLYQLDYLNIGGALIVQSLGGDALASPTSSNLGTAANLYFAPYGS